MTFAITCLSIYESGDSRIKDIGMLLVPRYLCILEHSARSQIAIGRLHTALLQKETAFLL